MSAKMARFLFALLLATLVSSVVSQEEWRPRLLGTHPHKHAAFLQLFETLEPNVNPLDKYTLYVSTFSGATFFQTDDIFYMRSPGRSLTNITDWELQFIDDTHYWPNDVCYTPKEVVGTEAIIWTSGFLVPTKTEGHLSIYLTNSDPLDGPYNIASLDDKDYSYHRVIWHDVNHDGFLDAISPRFHVDGAITTGSLVWFENPGLGRPTEGWSSHMIFEDGPDVGFQITTFQVEGKDFVVLIASEFFNEQLTIYYSADGSNSFLSDSTKLIQRVLDKSVGRAFDVVMADLNLDGKEEILLTAYNYTEAGNVLAYEVPNDFRIDQFERHVLASGFIPNDLPGETMSPGAPLSFFRGVEHEQSGDKPYVFVSGDDDGCHYIITPDSPQDPNDWSYTKNQLINTTGSISGKYSIADLDNDGYNDVIAAGYSSGQLYIYTYAP